MAIVESNVPMHMVATDILGEFPTSTFWSSQTALRSGPNVSQEVFVRYGISFTVHFDQ